MIKIYIKFIAIMFIVMQVSFLKSQNSWVWAKDFGQSATDIYDIQIDENGNPIILGNTNGVQIIGGTIYNSQNFMSNLDKINGNLINTGFNNSLSMANNYSSNMFKVDNGGNKFFVGNYNGGNGVHKISSTGALLWTTSFIQIGGGSFTICDFAIDANGNSFALVAFNCYQLSVSGQIVLSQQNNSNPPGLYLLKIDAFGFYVWENLVQLVYFSPNNFRAGEIVIDSQNYIYASLTIAGASGSYHIAKFNQGAQLIWSNTIQCSGFAYGSYNNLSIDNQDNVYMSAHYDGGIQFSPTIALISQGGVDAFIAKFTPNGSISWARGLSGLGDDIIQDMAYGNNTLLITGLTGSNNVISLGNYNVTPVSQNIYIGIVDPATGTPTGLELVTDPINPIASGRIDIAGGQNGHFYFVGYTTGVATFGTTVVGQANNGIEPFIAKYAVCNLQQPVITTSGNTTFCQGDSVILSSNVATGNIWSNNSTAQSITVVNSGTYTVTVSDINGCLSTSNPIIVTTTPLPTAPTISINGALTFCDGDSVILTSSSPTNNSWSNGYTTQNIIVKATGTYMVSVVNNLGCTSTSQPVNIIVNPTPPMPTINQVGNLLISSSASGNQWLLNGNPIPNETSQIYTATQNGNYSVLVTNNWGCTSISPFAIISNVSIDNSALKEIIDIYPNPSMGKVYIKNKQDMNLSIKITNIMGEIITSKEMNKLDEDMVELHSKGLYFISVHTNYFTYTYKILNE